MLAGTSVKTFPGGFVGGPFEAMPGWRIEGRYEPDLAPFSG